MSDAASLHEQLNRISVQLLLTDADAALTFVQVAEGTRSEERAKHAIRNARRAYDVISEKRPQFRFSKHAAETLETKLQNLRSRLLLLGEAFEAEPKS